ncbi:MAG: hypothetical protein L6R41_001243 [Letrouitia leprolyta]|nr:MAG: hypothetical protein L6R41_001243 [Letrouitia leprolyta]
MSAIFALIVFIVAAIVTGSPITKDTTNHTATLSTYTVAVLTAAPTTSNTTYLVDDRLTRPLLPRAASSSSFSSPYVSPSTITVPTHYETTVGVIIVTRTVNPTITVTHIIKSNEDDSQFGDLPAINGGTLAKRRHHHTSSVSQIVVPLPVTITVPTTFMTKVQTVEVTQTTTTPTPTSVTVTDTVTPKAEDMGFGSLPAVNGITPFAERETLLPSKGMEERHIEERHIPIPHNPILSSFVLSFFPHVGEYSISIPSASPPDNDGTKPGPEPTPLARREESVLDKDMMDEGDIPLPTVSLPPGPDDYPGKPGFVPSAPHDSATKTVPTWELPPFYGAPGPVAITGINRPHITIPPVPVTQTEHSVGLHISLPSPSVIYDWVTIPHITRTEPPMSTHKA